MKIPKEMLAEKNYEGTRLIPVTDPLVLKLKKDLNELQKKANPILKRMEPITAKLDPYYQQIGQLNKKVSDLKAEMQPIKEEFDVEQAKLTVIDQKAQLIKNKMQPAIDAIIKDKLGEFERPLHATEKNGVIYVEIQDELEEKIKQLRAKNAKK